MDALPERPAGTVAVLSTGAEAPHESRSPPRSGAGARLALGLALRREPLVRLRGELRRAGADLACGAAIEVTGVRRSSGSLERIAVARVDVERSRVTVTCGSRSTPACADRTSAEAARPTPRRAQPWAVGTTISSATLTRAGAAAA